MKIIIYSKATLWFLIPFWNSKSFSQEKIYFNSLSERVLDTSSASYYEITKLDSTIKGKKAVFVYNMDGSIKAEMNFIEDKVDGILRTYFANGKIENEMSFKNDKLEGSKIKFWINGAIRRKEIYIKGVFKEGKCYDSLATEIEYFPSEREVMLSPPYRDINNYFKHELKIPKDIVESSYTEKIEITFTITKEGKIENIATIRGFTAKANKEIMDIIQKMPIKSPAIKDDEFVDTYIVYPFLFDFEEK